jgi:hypothetical protein
MIQVIHGIATPVGMNMIIARVMITARIMSIVQIMGIVRAMTIAKTMNTVKAMNTVRVLVIVRVMNTARIVKRIILSIVTTAAIPTQKAVIDVLSQVPTHKSPDQLAIAKGNQEVLKVKVTNLTKEIPDI